MDSGRVLAVLGFIILIGCVIGVVLIIYNGGTERSNTVPQSQGRDGRRHSVITAKKESSFATDLHDKSPQSTTQNLNDLQRQSPPKTKRTKITGKTENRTIKPTQNNRKNNGSLLALDHYKPASAVHRSSTSSVPKKATISAVNYSAVPKQNTPSALLTSFPKKYHSKSPGATIYPALHSTHQTTGQILGVPSPVEKATTLRTIPEGSDGQNITDSGSGEYEYYDFSEENENDNLQLTKTEKSAVNSFSLDDSSHWEAETSTQSEQENTVISEQLNFSANFQELMQLAGQLSRTAPSNNSVDSVIQGFLKVINETIKPENTDKLVANMNKMYQRRPANQEKVVNGTKDKNFKQPLQNTDKTLGIHETSLPAFIFMSFGVFLLNQIHNFVQMSGLSLNMHSGNTEKGSGRALIGADFFEWFSQATQEKLSQNTDGLLVEKESSLLDFLFQEPESAEPASAEQASLQPEPGSNFSELRGRSISDNNDFSKTSSSSKYVNNMSRGLLNIVNAYSKDSEALECIWSLYCQDLDSTSGKRGLYGVAARINSVGLRLIMNQIPPSLAMDVILRSLVEWDGLPCQKMFPACTEDKKNL